MKKSMHALLALTLVSAFALTACGGTKETANPAPAPAPAAAPATVTQDQIKDGVSKMLHALDEAESAISAKDNAGIQKAASEADEAWDPFEDGVKAKSKTLYRDIEEQLSLLKSGAKAQPADTKVIGGAIDKLRDLLNQAAK